jgi:hypothetical protein
MMCVLPLLSLLILIPVNLLQQAPIQDEPSDRLLTKFKEHFVRTYNEKLDTVDLRQPQYRDEEFVLLYENIRVEMPDPEGEKPERKLEYVPKRCGLFSLTNGLWPDTYVFFCVF